MPHTLPDYALPYLCPIKAYAVSWSNYALFAECFCNSLQFNVIASGYIIESNCVIRLRVCDCLFPWMRSRGIQADRQILPIRSALLGRQTFQLVSKILATIYP